MTRTERSDEWLNNKPVVSPQYTTPKCLGWYITKHCYTLQLQERCRLLRNFRYYYHHTLISLLNPYHIIIKGVYEMMPCSLGNWYQLIGGRYYLGRQVRRNTLRSLVSYIDNTVIFNLHSFILKLETANPSGRAVSDLGLRPLACWGCGFESHWSMDVCLSWLLCVVS